jgi:hypothetical protein
VELKLGQHGEVQHDGQLVATQVRVVAEAEGMVSAVDTGAGTPTVAGQAVTVHTDPVPGPVTAVEGYASLAAVHVSDRVEVHGIIRTDSSGKASLQATRIEKSGATADTADHVEGLVANLSTSDEEGSHLRPVERQDRVPQRECGRAAVPAAGSAGYEQRRRAARDQDRRPASAGMRPGRRRRPGCSHVFPRFQAGVPSLAAGDLPHVSSYTMADSGLRVSQPSASSMGAG